MIVRRLATTQPDFEAQFRALQWSAETDASIDAAVAAIVADVLIPEKITGSAAGTRR